MHEETGLKCSAWVHLHEAVSSQMLQVMILQGRMKTQSMLIAQLKACMWNSQFRSRRTGTAGTVSAFDAPRTLSGYPSNAAVLQTGLLAIPSFPDMLVLPAHPKPHVIRKRQLNHVVQVKISISASQG